EGVARDPRARDLQDQALGTAPALADPRLGQVVALDGEVLAEDPVPELPSEQRLEVAVVLPRVGVDRLPGAAVVPDVADPVPGQSNAAPALGARRGDGDRTLDRPLVDAGELGLLLPRIVLGLADV